MPYITFDLSAERRPRAVDSGPMADAQGRRYVRVALFDGDAELLLGILADDAGIVAAFTPLIAELTALRDAAWHRIDDHAQDDEELPGKLDGLASLDDSEAVPA